ncbi:hypothetical protein GCM10010266_23980 [Streptomyces griseomycini]|nr:hypothetical protein GCM10010266_23980 [Streptomyces griseomycini]
MQGGDGGAAAGGELADRELVDLLWNLGHPSEPTGPSGARSVDRGRAADHAKQLLRHVCSDAHATT